MAKINKLIIVVLSVICLYILCFSFNVEATEVITTGTSPLATTIDTTSNYFTQKTNTEKITITDKRDSITSIASGYKKAIENEYLIVYYKKSTLGIAIYDKTNGYMWFSTYSDIDNYNLTPALKGKINAGVSIEYINISRDGTIVSTETYFGAKKNGQAVASMEYEKLNDEVGFLFKIDFTSFGIKFNIKITIDGKKLLVSVPSDSIEEYTVGTLNPVNYYLNSITLFPYLGSDNYNINGYSFIPDGSGALIRYTNEISSTAYIKQVYNTDYSFQDQNTTYTNIKDDVGLAMPIYGVNHGYNQAAFLCEATNGYGALKLLSYPYMYNNIPINTTFFKFTVRDTFKVSMTSGDMMLLNDNPYNFDYSLKYTFLENEQANYVGMADCYRESLGINDLKDNLTKTPLRLKILGVDYKPGLFGKNYVIMTTYKDAKEIINDLNKNYSVDNLHISYLGWNKGGFYNKSASNAKASTLLGGKHDLKDFNKFIKDNNFTVDYVIDPLVSNNYGFNTKTIKKVNYESFNLTSSSAINSVRYFVAPTELANRVLSKNNKYNKLGIDSLNIESISDASYSYRYNGTTYYREEMIRQMTNELDKLSSFNLSTSKPYSYLYKYLNSYYDMYSESSKFIYETDSIPFVSILLSGYVNLYSSDINYSSDYELSNLRMIEYNLYPSFIVTKEEAYKLRYTNYEYLNSCQYDLWKEQIVSSYDKVSNALDNVCNAKIINHEYIDIGLAKVTYNNGIIVYINYNNISKTVGSNSIPEFSYLVVKENG